ncbi:MAG: hypothetical protein ACJAXJ_000962 [Colwellia sp.]|jgi:hypothetical protein|tara:strand:- start:28494 stop:29330 length:837 start_codon:yes stop_codon:yes gene_type:complete
MLALNNSTRLSLDKLLVEYHIFSYEQPIMITFSPAGYVLSQSEVIKGRSAWAFEFFKKMQINIIAFSAVEDAHWFLNESSQVHIAELSRHLKIFPERLGYGASMGAYAASHYAEQLHLDRLLLITPKVTPKRIDTKYDFNYCNSFDGEITLIYDPFCSADKECALNYPSKTNYLKFYGVGHQVIESISHIGYLKALVVNFISDKINTDEFAKQSRKRKELERYYSYLQRNPTKKNSTKRKRIVSYYFILWSLQNLDKVFQKHRVKIKKNLRRKTKLFR